MALNYYHVIMIEDRADNIAPHRIIRSAAVGRIPIVVRGFVDTQQVDLFLYARSTGSDIVGSGYKEWKKGRSTAQNTYTGGGLTLPVNDAPIEEFATEAGALDGVTVNSVVLRCKCYKYQAGPVTTKFIRLRLYHRTSGGTETQIDTTTITAGNYPYQIYDRAFASLAQAMSTDERLVIKYQSNFYNPF